ncbi:MULTISPECIES: hypothetical protein [unclassified Clostridium]|uniref:hypothetical protein n=1 Tax=unclassified Clostridium TaxID=2614128 RepID=UPI0025C0F018|nr:MULTISPECIES: hypothetical protein [unclassified Clostridium]
MKIEMEVKKINTEYTWKETYNIESDIDPKLYAEQLVANFNATLRPNESPRELVHVKIIEQDSEVMHQHTWEKQNLFTLKNINGYYDVMKCSRCEVTGKRYGLNEYVKRDSKYKAKCYETCEGSIKQLAKLRK